MVKVPVYQQDVSLRPILQQDLEIRAKPEAFGWDVGQGVANLGKGMQQASNTLIELQDLESTTETKTGQNKLMEWARNRQWGPGGYMTLQGDAAIKGRSVFEQEVEAKRKEIMGTLSPRAQQKFNDSSMAYINPLFNQAIVHEGQERKKFINDTSVASQNNFANEALVNYSDPNRVNTFVAAGQLEIRKNSQLNGEPAEVTKMKEEAFVSNALKGVTLRLNQDSPLKAQEYYNKNKALFNGPDQFAIEQNLKEGLQTAEAQQHVDFVRGLRREVGGVAPAPMAGPAGTPGAPMAMPPKTVADTGPTRVRAYLIGKAASPEERARVESLDPTFATNLASMLQDAPAEMRDKLGVYSGKPQRPGTGMSPEDMATSPLARPAAAPVSRPRGPVANFAPEVNSAIDSAARKHGLPPEMLREFARIESSGNPGARTGKYMGLFQLSQEEFSRLGGTDIFDPVQNAEIAAKKLKTEIGTAKNALGRTPTAFDLYMIHQQGIGGYPNHVKNPSAPAWQNMYATGEGQQKGEAWARKAIWGNVPDDVKARFGSVDNITSAQFVEIWRNKFRGDSSTPLDGSAPVGSPQAVDLAWEGQTLQAAPKDVQDWVHQNAPKYGLYFPAAMPWRVEQIGSAKPNPTAPNVATVQPANTMLSPRANMPSMEQVSGYLNKIQNPEVRQRAYKIIMNDFALADKQRAAQVEEAKLTLQSHVIKGNTPDTLPMEIRMLAGTDAINSAWGFAEKEKQGRVVTDEVLFSQVQELAARDPKGFAAMDLTPLMDKLSREDWRKVNELKTSALKDERKAREDGLNLTEAFNQASTQLEAVGITTKGKKDAEYQKAQLRIAQFNNALASEMETFKKNNGVAPTQMDILKMINRQLLPIVIKNNGFIGDTAIGQLFGVGNKNGFAFEAGTRPDDSTVNVVPKYEDIPIDLRRSISADLELANGRKPTKEEIIERYKAYTLSR